MAAAAVLFSQGLTDTAADYDEGVYLASADALRHGQELGTNVFSSQLPGFYDLLVAAAGIFGTTLEGVRVAVLLLALVACAAAYVAASRLADWAAGLLAAAGVAAMPFFALYAHRIAADLPSVSCVLVSIAALTFPGAGAATAAGAALGLAVSIKLSGVVGAVPVLVLLLQRRLSLRRAAFWLAGAGAVLAIVLLAHRGALEEIWRGAVTYHDRARDVPFEGHNEYRLRHDVLGPRVPFAWFLALGVIGSLLSDRVRRLALPYWAYAVVAGGFLLWHRPLHDNHFVVLAPVAVPAAIGVTAGARALPPPLRRLAALGASVALALALASSWNDARAARGPEPTEIVRGAKLVEQQVPRGGLVVSDRQYVAVLAHRRVPGDLVDTAVLRFQTGMLTQRRVEEVIQGSRVRAVFAGRAFLLRPGLMAFLRARFPTRYELGTATLFVRDRP